MLILLKQRTQWDNSSLCDLSTDHRLLFTDHHPSSYATILPLQIYITWVTDRSSATAGSTSSNKEPMATIPTDLPNKAPDFSIEELFEIGTHFGHETTKWHPKMKEWIFSEHNGVHLINLEKTIEQMKLAYNLAYSLGANNKTMILVGTKRAAKAVVVEAAQASGLFYITSRWLGGLLTNWEQVKKSLKRMLDIEEGLKTGKYAGYTKYEQVQLGKDRDRLARFFEGLRGLNGLPDAVCVIDPVRESIVVAEARKVNIPVIAIADTNANPEDVDLIIPANDDSTKVLKYLVDNVIAAGYKAGKEGK